MPGDPERDLAEWVEELVRAVSAEPLPGGYRLLDWDLDQGISLAFDRRGESLLVELSARDDQMGAWSRTNRFNLVARDPFRDGGLGAESVGFLRELTRRLAEHEGRLPAVSRQAAASARTQIRSISATRALVREGRGQYYLNPYVGCTIGCSFCFVGDQADLARSLGGLPKLPWGLWVDVKTNLPEVLAREVRELVPRALHVEAEPLPFRQESECPPRGGHRQHHHAHEHEQEHQYGGRAVGEAWAVPKPVGGNQPEVRDQVQQRSQQGEPRPDAKSGTIDDEQQCPDIGQREQAPIRGAVGGPKHRLEERRAAADGVDADAECEHPIGRAPASERVEEPAGVSDGAAERGEVQEIGFELTRPLEVEESRQHEHAEDESARRHDALGAERCSLDHRDQNGVQPLRQHSQFFRKMCWSS
ncbi:MAG: hypothetical protein U0263_25320 [Polyangiaceae bacterium]